MAVLFMNLQVPIYLKGWTFNKTNLTVNLIVAAGKKHLAIFYKAQLLPRLEYYSHVWSAEVPTAIFLLDAGQKRAIPLVND